MYLDRDHKLYIKALILDLMRAFAPEPLSIQSLIRATALFGFNDNQTRVSVNRMIAKDRLESVDRGLYSLGQAGSEIWRFSQEWRIGEDRLQPWTGEWLTIALPKTASRTELGKSKKSLWIFGFRLTLLDHLYIRPDNLRIAPQRLKLRMESLGLSPSSMIWRSSAIDEEHQDNWSGLWQTEEWDVWHRQSTLALQDSLDHHQKKSTVTNLRESFRLGDRAIELLIKDPLLPQQMASDQARLEHTQMMLKYDELGRSLWKKVFDEYRGDL